MNNMTWLKYASAALLAAMLAACGGGSGGAASTPLPEVPWGSPAVFVTPGAASKSFALTGCTTGFLDSVVEQPLAQDRENLYNASLRIASNGDVSILASTTQTATATVMLTIAYADASAVSWEAFGNTQAPAYGLAIAKFLSGDTGSVIYVTQKNPLGAYFIEARADGGETIACTLSEPLALQVNADQARAAKNLGTAAGVTTFDGRSAAGRIEGGNAFWESNTAPSSFDQYNFMRFNLTTGELASNSTGTGTYAPISLSLPSVTTSYGGYGESILRNYSYFGEKEAKGICLDFYELQTERGFSIDAYASGNSFSPRGIMRSAPTGLVEPTPIESIPPACFFSRRQL